MQAASQPKKMFWQVVRATMEVMPKVKIDMECPAAWQLKNAAVQPAVQPVDLAANFLPWRPAEAIPLRAMSGRRTLDGFMVYYGYQ